MSFLILKSNEKKKRKDQTWIGKKYWDREGNKGWFPQLRIEEVLNHNVDKLKCMGKQFDACTSFACVHTSSKRTKVGEPWNYYNKI